MIRNNKKERENKMDLQKLKLMNLKTGNTISFEDLVTVVCTKFVKMNKEDLQEFWETKNGGFYVRTSYLKKNFEKRRKISEKIIKSLSI